MSPELMELAKALVAHPMWAWKAGMLTDLGERIVEPWGAYLRIGEAVMQGGWGGMDTWVESPELDLVQLEGRLPDLEDPATAGTLLGMLGDKLYSVSRFHDGRWMVTIIVHTSGPAFGAHVVEDHKGAMLGEAAARALLALWNDK